MFASSTGFRWAGIVLALVLPLVGERADAACENIVALSEGQGRVEYIAGPRRIWLLDAQTLTIVAESEIPFQRNYFVFE